MNKDIKAYLKEIGSNGGKAAGERKRRGSKAYYQELARLSAKARKAKKKETP